MTVTVTERLNRGWLVAALIAPGLVVFALPMVRLIGRNEEYFGESYGAGRDLFVAAGLATAVGVALWAARRHARRC